MKTCLDPTKGFSSGEIIKQVMIHKIYVRLTGSRLVHKVKNDMRYIKNSYDAI
jgi:hypothetical protein